MSKFKEQFKVLLKGETTDLTIERVYKTVVSALKAQLATLTGDLADAQFDLDEARESLRLAKLYYGKSDINREDYINGLITKYNKVIECENNLQALQDTYEFLELTLKEVEE